MRIDPTLTAATAPSFSYSTGRTIIVVPCYNEAQRLDVGAFHAALEMLPGIDFLFVDDGSRDATLERLQDMAKRAPSRISVLALPRNGGKAEAVRQGLIEATARGAAITGYWDADLATPLDAIGDMLRVLNRHDHVEVIFGSRRPLLGHKIERADNRRLVSRICNALARVALRMPIGDTQCGAKMLRATPSLTRALAAPFQAGWLFDIELFSRLGTNGTTQAAFYEMPLAEWYEIPGSKVSARAVLRAGVQMLGLIAEIRIAPLAQRAAFL
ncbi:putative glycosyltransferase YkoT [Roseivivax sp. THAF40]|uniref:glycosyltransferase n=1 Tax=unclassified Roseivivax TaxID=2639302 RepID=UPI0012A9B6EC|nr:MULTISPECIES: glycosyltransferase [unclassified Roseivivax]QFS83721.1 putative glycosyltransferase YkoT [Roseivivax sp. THAF197b]QFT47523.1 putative glycosyltransferase YkoT [Roseivivax sp. THAF40]